MIEVRDLVKQYGRHIAVDHLSFTVPDGQIFGFLGPNGAGKSTMMNLMTGYLGPTSGEILVDGHSVVREPEAAKRAIGYLPEQLPLYLDMTVEEYLEFAAQLKKVPRRERGEQTARVMELTGITGVRGRLLRNLSKGYRQRVGLAQALLGFPKVLILDEPTVGLDPIQIIEIRDLIRQLGQDHTVIFSSHILSEVQTICDQILMIAHGQLVAFDRPENLEKQLLSPNEITISTDASPDQAAQILAPVAHLSQVDVVGTEAGIATLRLKTDAQDIHAVSRAVFLAFAQSGQVLLELSLKKANLEDIFLELTEQHPAENTAGEQEADKP